MEKQFIFVAILFFIILFVLLGIIYYVSNKQSTTDEVISLLNTKITKLTDNLKDSKINQKKKLSDLDDDISENIASIVQDINTINETSDTNTHLEENISENKSDILSNQRGLSSNQTNIQKIVTDYNLLNSNVMELKAFEGSFTTSLADLNTLLDDRKLYVDDKIHTLELDKNDFNTRIQSNYGLASSNMIALSNNRADIDATYTLAYENRDILLEFENNLEINLSNLSRKQLGDLDYLVSVMPSINIMEDELRADTAELRADTDELRADTDNKFSQLGDLEDITRKMNVLTDLIEEEDIDTSITYGYILPNIKSEPTFRLTNHINSKYLTHYNEEELHVNNPYFMDSEGNYKFVCEPHDYLITFYTGNKYQQNAILFEGLYGNTQSQLTNEPKNKYLIINRDQVDLNIPIDESEYMGNVFQTENEAGNDLHLTELKSMYVPSHMDLVFKDNDSDEEKRLRDYYPTQIFISQNSLQLGEFWEFVGNIRNGYVRLTYREANMLNNIHIYRVTSVFLRNKYVPFSVIEFQQNETVYWADLMSYVSMEYEFVTNNGIIHTRYVMYIPQGAGLQILDVHNVEIHELINTTRDILPEDHYIPIEHILCDREICVPVTNPIIATSIAMTIQIRMKSAYDTRNSPYQVPVFKVI